VECQQRRTAAELIDNSDSAIYSLAVGLAGRRFAYGASDNVVLARAAFLTPKSRRNEIEARTDPALSTTIRPNALSQWNMGNRR
jgi:hypothetical protein